jgi:putative ABC transport system ATP-binding protein
MMILQKLNERGITIVLVTHDPTIASYCRRQIHFRDGKVIEDTVNVTPLKAQELLSQQASERRL